MLRNCLTRLLPAITLSLIPKFAQAGAVTPELLYATDGASIARFNTASPASVITTTVSGLQGGDTLVGIDVRPANNVLYGLGASGKLYTVDPITGVATPLAGGPNIAPNGNKFGADFNPVTDQFRFTSDTQQNVRLNPDDGTIAQFDPNLSAEGIAEIAYSSNVPTATSTTLYAINATTNALNLIGSINGAPNSPNGGAVTQVGSGFGIDPAATVGFDISGVSGIPYACLTVGGVTRLYDLNLSTGQALPIGTIGNGTKPFIGLSVALIPEPTTLSLLTITATAFLIRRPRSRRRSVGLDDEATAKHDAPRLTPAAACIT
jgi:hypothetical protein